MSGKPNFPSIKKPSDIRQLPSDIEMERLQVAHIKKNQISKEDYFKLITERDGIRQDNH